MDFIIDENSWKEFQEYKQFLAFKNGQTPEVPSQRPPTVLVKEEPKQEPTNEEILYERKFIERARPIEEVIVHQAPTVESTKIAPLSYEKIKFYITAILSDLTGKFPLLGSDKIFERLHSRYPQSRGTDYNDIVKVLITETIEHGNLRRYMTGHNKYCYMLSKFSMERGDHIFYNPDVKAGSAKAMFWNIRGAILKHAKDNNIFNGNEFVNKMCQEFAFIKDKDKAKFKTSLYTELSNLTIKGTLERGGEQGDRIYYYK